MHPRLGKTELAKASAAAYAFVLDRYRSKGGTAGAEDREDGAA